MQPTGKQIEVPVVAIVEIEDGKIAHEHICWDQSSVLAQIGLLDLTELPVTGRQARKVLSRAAVERAIRQDEALTR